MHFRRAHFWKYRAIFSVNTGFSPQKGLATEKPSRTPNGHTPTVVKLKILKFLALYRVYTRGLRGQKTFMNADRG